MPDCRVPIFLAYAMLVYVMASIGYILLTRCVGTPFRDSLTPQQLKIKATSASIRGSIFWGSLCLSILIVWIWSPFQKCAKEP